MRKMIARRDVMAIIDAKIDSHNDLLNNPGCRGMNRQMVASNIGVLQKLMAEISLLDAEEAA